METSACTSFMVLAKEWKRDALWFTFDVVKKNAIKSQICFDFWVRTHSVAVWLTKTLSLHVPQLTVFSPSIST